MLNYAEIKDDEIVGDSLNNAGPETLQLVPEDIVIIKLHIPNVKTVGKNTFYWCKSL